MTIKDDVVDVLREYDNTQIFSTQKRRSISGQCGYCALGWIYERTNIQQGYGRWEQDMSHPLFGTQEYNYRAFSLSPIDIWLNRLASSKFAGSMPRLMSRFDNKSRTVITGRSSIRQVIVWLNDTERHSFLEIADRIEKYT